MTLIIGSQSPRRREILKYFSIPMQTASPDFDETSIPFNDNVSEYVCEIARGKALSLVEQFPDDVILSADTVVYCNGKLYTKPSDKVDALRILQELSGQWHSVFTGIVVIKNNKEYCDFEETKILFNNITKENLNKYYEQLHCNDKAGGYAIQRSGSLIIKKIDGCFYNVMGLPINTAQKLLAMAGIDLWDHLNGTIKPDNTITKNHL